MKETVVEWLFQELNNYYNLMSDYKTRQEILEKAKEMEKQQIIDAYDKVSMNTGEQYYNETFNK